MEDERNIQDIQTTPPTPPDFSNVIANINYNLPDNNTQAITAEKLRTTLTYVMSNVSTAIYDKDNDRIVDSLTSSDTNRALSANQGMVLNNSIGTIQTTLSGLVVDNLTSTATDKALSANQGRILNTSLTGLSNNVSQINTSIVRIEDAVSQNSYNIQALSNDLNGMFTDYSYGDLGFADASGYVIGRFSYGGIQTKYFDSNAITFSNCDADLQSRIEAGGADLPIIDYSNGDFGFADNTGYVLAKFSAGGIQTKNFNSNAITFSNCDADLQSRIDSGSGGGGGAITTDKFVGKRISILGDSLSSFSGYMPSSLPNYPGTAVYLPHYPHGQVQSVNQTWWWMAATTLGIDPNTNVNSCGFGTSTITGDSTSTTNAFVGTSDRRIADLSFKFGGTAPDITLILMGANDYNSQRPLGDWTYETGIPAEGTIGTLKAAFALCCKKIYAAYPNTRIFIMLLWDRQLNYGNTWPTKKQGGTIYLKQYNDAIREVAEDFGCGIIDTTECGINWWNTMTYTEDGCHPNAAGMQLIAHKVVDELLIQY